MKLVHPMADCDVWRLVKVGVAYSVVVPCLLYNQSSKDSVRVFSKSMGIASFLQSDEMDGISFIRKVMAAGSLHRRRCSKVSGLR